MSEIGFDAARESDELSRTELRRIAAALREQLDTLEDEREQLEYSLERLDEKIAEIREYLFQQ